MRAVLVWMAVLAPIAVARAETPAIHFGPLKIEHAIEAGAAGVRVTQLIGSDGLVGRMCVTRFHLQQGDRSTQETRRRAVSVPQWSESAFYPRTVLADRFDPRQPILVTFQLLDVVDQRELGSATGTIAPEASEPRLLLQEISVLSYGKSIYRGAIDLRPTWERIHRGERFPHRTDGSVFNDRERKLPKRAGKWWREYVHPTPGVKGPGPQRLVIGREGEVFYSPDHYRTFIRLDEVAK